MSTLWPAERLCLGDSLLLAAPYSCLKHYSVLRQKTDYADQAGDLTDSRSICQGSSNAPRCEQSCLFPSGKLLPEASWLGSQVWQLMLKGAGHSDDVHCTEDFLNRQQSSPHIQDQYQACHWPCYVSLGGKTWISRCCLLHHRDIWTTVTRSNIHAYCFRSQCCCCSYWPWVLLICLLLSLRGSRITWLTGFLSPLWKDPDGSAWWLPTCPEGCLLALVTKQLYFVTPPF